MVTNCELPNSLLKYNMELNDYDFVLFHLLRDNKEYREYYFNMKRNHPERLMILDNSAYEFFVKGEELNLDEFVKWINWLMPDYYILPDYLMDREKTINSIIEFMDKYKIECSKPLAVAQGNNSDDLFTCLLQYKRWGIDYVGIPFHLSFYKNYHKHDDVTHEFLTTYKECNEDLLYAMGRVCWLRDHEEFLKAFDKVHLLGSHCPLEKLFYKGFYSMDTGYPVKLGIKKEHLFTENGKPNIIIDEFLNSELSQNQIDAIISNVKKFKDI